MNGLGSVEVWYRPLIPGTREWNTLAAFLFLSLTFALPSGYSLGALMLLIGAVITLSRDGPPQITAREKFVIVAFAAYAVIWIGDGFLRGDGVSDADRPFRFLLAIPVILSLKRKPPGIAALVAGLIIGALGAGGIAAHDIHVAGLARAKGFMPTNSFGMLAALFGVMSFLAYRYTSWERKALTVRLLFLVASLAALYAVLSSGSRGAWLVILGLAPLFFWLEIRHSGKTLFSRLAVLILMAGSLLIALLYIDTVRNRVDSAVAGVTDYVAGESADGSIGTRLNMWTGGLMLVDEKPWLGFGNYGYQQHMERLAEENKIESVGKWDRHLHNQIIHVLVTKGLLGGIAWLLLSITPIIGASAIYPGLSPEKNRKNLKRPMSPLLLGIIPVMAFHLSGLTRTPFEHHSSVMIFAFGLPVLFSIGYGLAGRKRSTEKAE